LLVALVKLLAGRLRHRIRVEQQVQTKNSFGETDVEWEELDTFWAEIRPLSARDLLASEQVASESTTVIIMRYNSAIKASMRAVHVINGVDGTIFNLAPPIRDPETGLDWMSIPAIALINRG
jgi:SPP1 family predicted phage head-tail adaptor